MTQITVPPPPPATLLHCSTFATGEVETVVVVVHAPAPAEICAAVPRHFTSVTVDGGLAESAPVEVT